MHVRSYDLLSNEEAMAEDLAIIPGLKAARLVRDATVAAPTPTTVLFPNEGGRALLVPGIKEDLGGVPTTVWLVPLRGCVSSTDGGG